MRKANIIYLHIMKEEHFYNLLCSANFNITIVNELFSIITLLTRYNYPFLLSILTNTVLVLESVD